MSLRLAGGWKLAPAPKCLLKAKGKGTFWSSNRPTASHLQGTPASSRLTQGCPQGSSRPAVSTTTRRDRSQAADGQVGHPGARRQHPDADRPTWEAAPPPQPWSILGCLSPCWGRLRVLQGHCVQPREQSLASATGESQALAAVCCPGAADDPVSCRHISPVIARSLSGLMLHGVTEAGMSPQEASSPCTGTGAGVCRGRHKPSRVEGCPRGVSLSPLLAASALKALRSHPAAAAPVLCTTA